MTKALKFCIEDDKVFRYSPNAGIFEKEMFSNFMAPNMVKIMSKTSKII